MCRGRSATGKAKPEPVQHEAEADVAAIEVSPEAESSRLDPASKRELLGEPVMVGADQLRGIWLDSRGHIVTVYSTDAFSTRLKATLVKADGHETHLPIRPTSRGCRWQCGSAFLAAASSDQLWWQFPNGNVSIWEGCGRSSQVPDCSEQHEQSNEHSQWTPLGLSTIWPPNLVGSEPKAVFLLSGSLPSVWDLEGTSLSGCQSPAEAFFNPRPVLESAAPDATAAANAADVA
mmetsp:Transcript_128254/g.256147  ORF Transcript_128254/g.256147 Transcript_128254/m.256147 type:complete len:233 (-) Transcript_128254:239-937(-)